MTVEYTSEVATCRGLGNFHRLLIRWKGSIYKVVWPELIVYLLCYYSINFTYRFYLEYHCDKKKFFIDLVRYCDAYGKDIPISFVLGFYVSIVVNRWWNQFFYLPWPDNLALTVACTVDGRDDRGRLIRRTIMRYTNLCFVLVLRMMSTQAKIRFPTLKHLVDAGTMHEHEKDIIFDLNSKTTHPKYWVPIVWAGAVARRARSEGKIRDDISLNSVVAQLNNFRRGCQEMLHYDWVNVPLVYTQVVSLAVYLYFLAGLIGKQLTVISEEEEPVDFYFPFFSFLEFFFYFGWLKVAECLINPYGTDDDDFEVNWMIDRYFQVSYVIVDEMHQEHPNMVKDTYWDEVFPVELPYTEGTAKFKATDGPVGSTRNVEVPPEKAEFVRFESPVEESERQNVIVSKHEHSPAESSADSIKEAFKKIPARGAASWRRVAGSIRSLRDHRSQMGSISSARERLRKGDSGTQDIKIEDLMEKEHEPYDPVKFHKEEEEKAAAQKEREMEEERNKKEREEEEKKREEEEKKDEESQG